MSDRVATLIKIILTSEQPGEVAAAAKVLRQHVGDVHKFADRVAAMLKPSEQPEQPRWISEMKKGRRWQ